MCNRVLDQLELGDLRLGQIVIKTVAVDKLGVNNGSGNGEAVLESRYEQYSEADEYGNSR